MATEKGMEQMTPQEAVATVRDMMDKWDYAMKVVTDQGYSDQDAQEIVGRYFTAKVAASLSAE